ncbi:MAG: elongation factor G [Proteobacteria bacterium]|uniref:elongation factor G n=1 Tax=Ottowia sp. TaxID=1898956 RepID=UPI0025E3A9C2|nr:elongation factor G [Ottowia sp.]MBS0413511.1 elongation factor G [Pseudomonadota bacterium]
MSTDADASIETLRTLALVGASGSGKTSLAEALLHASGAIGAMGSVERGSTVSDHDPTEIKAQHSLQASLLHLRHEGCRIHLIDTPGLLDFIGHSLPALEAVETAAIVVNAATGIEPMTRRMMEQAAERQLDRLIVVNKIDAEGADLAGLLADIQAVFGKACLPLNLPDAGASRVADCFYQREGASDFGAVADAHRALVEQVVEVDGAFVDRYLNEGDVDASELHAPLEQALREGHLVPVCFVSARSGAGVKELLDIIAKLLANPSEGNPPDFLNGADEAATPLHARPDATAHVLAHVFKISIDPYVGKLGFVRVHQGTITPGSQLYVGEGRKPFKVGHLYLQQGKEHVELPSAGPGAICAIGKVDELQFDAVLHDAAEDEAIRLKPMAYPVPVHGIAITPKRRGDEQRLWEVVGKLVAEDPCLRLERAAGTHETIVRGLGELHLRVLLERLRELHKFEVDTHPPRIAYRETITQNAAAQYRHKKQSGGAGQFGEVHLRVEPLARGAGFEFVDQVKGGTIPGQFMPAVEKGVREALAEGVIAGYPVQDVRVIVHEGKHHPVDSKEVAFVTAGKKAFQAAMREAKPVVLEPIARLQITAPEGATGAITGDLSARRGIVSGTDGGRDGELTISGQVPLAELADYQSRLNAMTAGQGRYSLALSHYAAVPPAVQQQLVSQYQQPSDE